MGNITVIGSSNTDLIMQVDNIPNPGETILATQFSITPGGKGANQAVAAARAGGAVNFIACIGKDIFGDNAIEVLKKENIDTSFIHRNNDTPSGIAMVYVDSNAENSISIAPGSNFELSPKNIDKSFDRIFENKIILAQLEVPIETVEHTARISRKHGITYILDPAPAELLSDDLLRNIDIITPNETEAEKLTGIAVTDETSARAACKKLHDRGTDTIIITMGSRGVFLSNSAHSLLLPSYKVDPIDTTGAGDIFNGALAKSLSEDSDIIEAIKFANAAAAISVTKFGAQASAPKESEIRALLG